MPRVNVRQAEMEREESDRDLCASCGAAAEGDGPYCRTCRDYWENDAACLDMWCEHEEGQS